MKKWNHPTTLDELFERHVTDEEKEEMVRIYMMRPIGQYRADIDIEAFVKEVFNNM